MAETIPVGPLKIAKTVIDIADAVIEGGKWVISQGLEELPHQVAIASTAQTLQLDPQVLGRMHYAADQVTGGYQGLDNALVTLQQRLGKVTAIGDESLTKWLDKLGLKAEELSRMNPEEAFFKVGDSLGTLSSRSEQLAAVTALMGDKASTFLPLLDQAPWKVEQLYEEADTLGVARSSEDIEKIKGIDNAIERVDLSTKGYALDGFIANSSMIQARGNNFAGDTATKGLGTGVYEGLEDILLDRFRGGASSVNPFDKSQESIVREAERALDAARGNYAQVKEVYDKVALRNPDVDMSQFPFAQSVAELDRKVQAAQGNLDAAQKGSRTQIDPLREVAAADAQLNMQGESSDGPPANNVAVSANDSLAVPDGFFARLEECLCGVSGVVGKATAANDEMSNGVLPVSGSEETDDPVGRKAAEYGAIEELAAKHGEVMAGTEEKRKSAEAKLWEEGWNGKAQVMSGVMGSISQLMNTENRKQFEIGKKAAMAQAVIDTYLSAQKAYTSLAGIPVVGHALGIAAAAAAVAAGMARVNSIKSQSFGGGGGAGGGASGGGAPSLPSGGTASGGGSAATGVTTSSKADAPVERQRVFVEFQGNEDSKMTARQWREFMRNLQEEAGDAQLEF